MNAFDAWGIKHLSASSLNAYISEPAIWVLKYVYGFKSDNAAMFRGSAVEKALCDSLRQNTGVEDCVSVAEFLFDSECERVKFPLGHPDVEKERSAIRPMIESGYAGLIPLAEEGMEFQKKIEIDLGVGVPLIGYIDILGSKVLELKTTLRMPSDKDQVKHSHWRQGSIYAVHEGKPAEIVYISPPVKSGAHKGFKMFPVENPEQYVNELRRAAVSLKRVLAAALTEDQPDRNTLQEFIVPDFDRFFWDEEAKAKALEVWAA